MIVSRVTCAVEVAAGRGGTGGNERQDLPPPVFLCCLVGRVFFFVKPRLKIFSCSSWHLLVKHPPSPLAKGLRTPRRVLFAPLQ